MLDVREAELGTAAAGDLDHRRAEVARDQAATLANDRGYLEPDVALAGRQLEHRVAGLRRELPDEPCGYGGRDLLPFLPHALPARGHRGPVLKPDAALLVGVHGTIVDASAAGS